MKAEHRKELETNVLADKVGRVVQNIKGGPQKRTVVYFILGIVAVIAVFLFFRSRETNRAENSSLWMMLEDGAAPYIRELITNDASSTPGKAARFHLAWLSLWDEGLKMLGHSPAEALKRIDRAEDTYKDLADECKDDPVFEPEALFALAVIEETRTLRKQEFLESAKLKYKELAEKYKDSAYGRMAQKRVEMLDTRQKDVLSLYQDLQISLRVMDEKLQPKGPPPLPGPP